MLLCSAASTGSDLSASIRYVSYRSSLAQWSSLILDLERTIKLYELLSEQDSLIIKFKDEEIYLLNQQIQLHLDRLDQVDKWYNKPSVGIAAGFLGTIILIQALDYTLPEWVI